MSENTERLLNLLRLGDMGVIDELATQIKRNEGNDLEETLYLMNMRLFDTHRRIEELKTQQEDEEAHRNRLLTSVFADTEYLIPVNQHDINKHKGKHYTYLMGRALHFDASESIKDGCLKTRVIEFKSTFQETNTSILPSRVVMLRVFPTPRVEKKKEFKYQTYIYQTDFFKQLRGKKYFGFKMSEDM